MSAAALTGMGLLWRSQQVQAERDSALTVARTGDFPAAEPLLKASLARSPGDVELLRILAKGYLALGRKAEAEDCLTHWLEQRPRELEALKMRLELYRDLGQYARALADLDQLIDVDPEDAAMHRKRPGLLFSLSRFGEAETECQACLEKETGDRGLRRLLAEIKRARGELGQAREILDRLLEESPGDTAALMGRATLYYHLDQPEKAVPDFRKVLELDPNRQRTGRYHLSLALARLGETEEARRLMDEVRHMQDAELLLLDSEKQRDNLPLQIRAARAQFENNDLPRTLHILEHVLRLDTDSDAAHALLAEVYERQGRSDLAAEHRRRAKRNP